MLNLIEVLMLKLGHDLRLQFLRVVKVITSPDWRRLASTSSEMFRTLRLAPTGRKFDQKLLSFKMDQLFALRSNIHLINIYRPTRLNSNQQNSFVELSRVERCDHGFKTENVKEGCHGEFKVGR